MREPIYSLTGKRVWVAGHRGMVGQALVRRLAAEHCKILTIDRASVDLRRQEATEAWMSQARPQAVFLAAAKVGGIFANSAFPAAFLYDNLIVAANVIEASRQVGVGKLMFLGSSCIYPKFAPQPIREEVLLSGPLEPTNEWYALAKIAGLKLCAAYRRQFGCDFISVQPTNLYGPGDNFHPKHSHVPAALIRRFHEAKIRGRPSVSVWGSGTPRREFLFVDDLADACVFVMQHYSADEPLNIGTGEDLTIRDFARLIAEVLGYKGKIVFDKFKPDGTPRKLLNVSRLAELGWQSQTPLRRGLEQTYRAFLQAEERTGTLCGDRRGVRNLSPFF
jgi:GDP-L-fucose synthase